MPLPNILVSESSKDAGNITKPTKYSWDILWIALLEPKKTYNSKDSLVVTHLTTNLPACGLSTAERTGSPVLHTLWSYVLSPAYLEYIIYTSSIGRLALRPFTLQELTSQL
ncbi:hypothetical protein N7446_013488 [Penicillium canescens]|nr:hypothetical protein N7446_013488 [Penicillium canescens]